MDDGRVRWFDRDLPEVIDLRRNFFEESERYHMVASSVTDLEWVDRIPTGQTVMVIAEGLFMYLQEEDHRALVARLAEVFPGCVLAFDAFSTLTARNVGRHPSLRKTGARIRWGLDDPRTQAAEVPPRLTPSVHPQGNRRMEGATGGRGAGRESTAP